MYSTPACNIHRRAKAELSGLVEDLFLVCSSSNRSPKCVCTPQERVHTTKNSLSDKCQIAAIVFEASCCDSRGQGPQSPQSGLPLFFDVEIDSQEIEHEMESTSRRRSSLQVSASSSPHKRRMKCKYLDMVKRRIREPL